MFFFFCVFTGVFENISISASIIFYNPSSSSSLVVIDQCSFSIISNSGPNGTVVHMGTSGNIEFRNNIFSDINTTSALVSSGVLTLLSSSAYSLIFENNVLENISSSKSGILLFGTSNGLTVSNCSFSSVLSNGSGGVFFFFIF
jgi:hypothetical protein